MNYYSTNQSAPAATLQEAVVKGLAPDRGLYMPEEIPLLPAGFFSEIVHSGVTDIARSVARALFGDDIPHDELARIVTDALNFEIPLVRVEEGLYALELFHGPTFAFKDVGARFMHHVILFCTAAGTGRGNCPVATSGDLMPWPTVFWEWRIRVLVYPSGKVSDIQRRSSPHLAGTSLQLRSTAPSTIVRHWSMAFMDEG